MKSIRQLKKMSVFPKSPERIKTPASQFASTLAHELRNPLANIILSVHEIGAISERNDDIKMYLDIISRSAERINKIVSMLLVHTSFDNLQREEYSVRQLLEEVLEITGDRIQLKHIAVNKNYGTMDCKTLINVQEMKMALTNIVINALDAMTMDNGQLKIITRPLADKLNVQIEDNGCGINKENLKNIFKLHFSNKPGGLGVGLASTWNILQANHVGVNVKSKVGSGTCFNLSFDCVH